MDMKQLNKIMKLLKALRDGQGKIKMYYGMFRIKKQLLEKKVYLKLNFLTLNLNFSLLFDKLDKINNLIELSLNLSLPVTISFVVFEIN